MARPFMYWERGRAAPRGGQRTHCLGGASNEKHDAAALRGPNRKYGAPFSGWQQHLGAQIGVSDHAPHHVVFAGRVVIHVCFEYLRVA